MKLVAFGNKALRLGSKVVEWIKPEITEVTIGTQTWKTKNLAIDDGGDGIIISDAAGMGTQYYYTWPAARRIADTIAGWHLPSDAEWDTLATNAGGVGTLKSINFWNPAGSDLYEFNAIPCEYFTNQGVYDDTFNGKYHSALFWTNDAFGSNGAYIRCMSDESNSKLYRYSANRIAGNSNYYSVRLIKD